MSQDARMLTFTPSPALFPFRSRWFDSSVGRVHYVDEGEGRPLLLLHGNPTWSFLYRHIIARLRDGYRCIAVDYPGFGLSVRPEGYGYTPAEHARVVGELVDHLGLDDLLLMAQDWGGPIGMAVALGRPDRISGLVFGNTWFWPPDRVSMVLFSRALSSPPARWAILQRNLFVELGLPLGTARTLSTQEMNTYRGAQPAPWARLGVAEFARQITASSGWLHELAVSAPRVLGSKPVLLVWGMQDLVFRPSVFLPRWRQSFPDHVLVELPSARHFIQEDAPAEIADAIRRRFR